MQQKLFLLSLKTIKGNEDKYHVVLSTHKDMNVGIGTSHIKKQLLGKVTGCKNRL